MVEWERNGETLSSFSGLLASAVMAHAQASSPPGAPGTQKTVHFDDSSTARLVLQARGEGVQIYACVKERHWEAFCGAYLAARRRE